MDWDVWRRATKRQKRLLLVEAAAKDGLKVLRVRFDANGHIKSVTYAPAVEK